MARGSIGKWKRAQVLVVGAVCAWCRWPEVRAPEESRRYRLAYAQVYGFEPWIWLEVDHMIPRSRGGSSELRNLRALCCLCNLYRGAHLDGELPAAVVMDRRFSACERMIRRAPFGRRDR